MTRSIITIVLTLLVASVFAIPLEPDTVQKRSFKVPRVPVDNYVADGPAALRRAYAKYGIKTMPKGPAALRKRQLNISIKPGGDVASRISKAVATPNAQNGNGRTAATGTQNNAQFLSPITVGGQQLVVNFDSGSSDTWVFNTNLPASAQRGHTIYNPARSSSFKLLPGETFEISYGDGSTASGPVGLETVNIGGSIVQNQAVGVPNQISDSFVTDSTANGLVGLAFSKLNTVQPTQQKTFFDNVVSRLTQPVYTAALRTDSKGFYEFGNIDKSAFTGELNVLPVDSSNGFWEFDSASAVIGTVNKLVNIPNGRAIADTGTSLMLVSDTLLSAYWQNVKGATVNDQIGGVIFPCNAQLPDLHVAVGNKKARVAGKNFNFAIVGVDQASKQTYCFGGLQSSGGIPFSIFGDVFFQSNFAVFEATTPSFGFAQHA